MIDSDSDEKKELEISLNQPTQIPYMLIGAVVLALSLTFLLLYTWLTPSVGNDPPAGVSVNTVTPSNLVEEFRIVMPSTTLAPLPTSRPTATLVPTLAEVPTLTVVIPDLEAVVVLGVKREYLNRGSRYFFQGQSGSFGAYLWSDSALSMKAPASNGHAVISNGDQVVILNQSDGIAEVRIVTNALDPEDPIVIGATGYIPLWLITDQNVPPPPPTPTPRREYLWVRRLNGNDDPTCISMQIIGINAAGWSFRVDGMNLVGTFDNAGNARLCELAPEQEVTITVYNQNGQVVPGGRGVPARGRDIMIGEWRR
jgi:hypothetical protein